MLATLLLLAQLVLPGPPSGPIQPPGMICLGECAGPVVWGPAERGRLVVACDMRSDTCSDGRKITTTRATPVPCETSPGVWEMVPEDTGCYGVRGLESWAQTTSYLSYGAELDRSPWFLLSSRNTLTPLEDGGYRLCHEEGAPENSGLRQATSLEQGDTATLAIVGRAASANKALLAIGGSFAEVDLQPNSWGEVSHTGTLSSSVNASIYPRPAGADQCIDLLGAWLTKSDTPGRPCWGGEAPVTCAADRHTISTEGWPTEEGEICISAEVGADATINRWLIDGRGPGATGNSRLVVRQGTNVLALLGPQGLVEGGTVTAGQHRICVHASGNTIRLSVDGVVVAQGDAVAPMEWFPMATIGSAYPTTGGTEIDGSIRSLTVRSFE